MMRPLAIIATGLGACTPTGDVLRDYQGANLEIIDADLVAVKVAMAGAELETDVQAYADCAAAQYALDEGYGFARNIRRKVDQEGSIWRGDAVYTLSKSLPRGETTIDAEVVVSGCLDAGIPTV